MGLAYRFPYSHARMTDQTIGDRIRERLAELDISGAELARRVNLTQPTISALISGKSRSSAHLHVIARALNTSVEFLTVETGDSAEGALPPPTPELIAEQLGMTLIPEINLRFALGGGSFIEEPIQTNLVPYRTEWLHRITRGMPADVFLARGDGDSMMPTILDEDDVIVNRADNQITRQDRIWALGYGDLVAIKRVRRMADGTFHLLSDNPNVRPIEALEEELRIIGRVIWIGRRM